MGMMIIPIDRTVVRIKGVILYIAPVTLSDTSVLSNQHMWLVKITIMGLKTSLQNYKHSINQIVFLESMCVETMTGKDVKKKTV